MKMSIKKLREVIGESVAESLSEVLGETLSEAGEGWGFRAGDLVRHREDTGLGVGTVRPINEKMRQVPVQWKNGQVLRHDPSALIKSKTDESANLSEGLRFHLEHRVGVDRNIYRPGSEKFFELFCEVRDLWKSGIYEASAAEVDLLETDVGTYGVYEGEVVPLDWPMLESDAALDEAEYKGKKVELGKPKRGSGGKAYVYVKNPKTGNVMKVQFGSSMPDAMGDSEEHRKRRKSFGNRHNCAKKKDRTKPGYWACRATKFFGRNIPGWW